MTGRSSTARPTRWWSGAPHPRCTTQEVHGTGGARHRRRATRRTGLVSFHDQGFEGRAHPGHGGRPGEPATGPARRAVTFLTLALIAVVALAGPLLALPVRWHLPVVLGELLAGIV